MSDQALLVSDMQFHDPEYKFEQAFWGNCVNTFMEEQKHFVYAKLMNIPVNSFKFDVRHQSVLDIGGGPISMLLKSVNLKRGLVCDPIKYPDWVYMRYRAKGIETIQLSGEDIDLVGWDEVWIYNVLQHTVNPEKIIANAKRAAPVIRLFEWIANRPPHPGHPHMLTEAGLRKWLGAPGKVVKLAESGCYGNAFSGTFTT